MKVKRVGIFGISADPVHKTHLAIANYCIKQKLVEEVWVCPSYNHTQKKSIASFEDRVDMCDMIFKKWFSPIKVMEIEKFNDNGSSYNLLKNLRILVGGRCTFSFIIGQDQADNIHTWYKYQDILGMDIPFIVFARTAFSNPNNIFQEKPWYHSQPHYFLQSMKSYISSTYVRDRIEKNQWNIVESLTSKKVCNLIKKRGLY